MITRVVATSKDGQDVDGLDVFLTNQEPKNVVTSLFPPVGYPPDTGTFGGNQPGWPHPCSIQWMAWFMCFDLRPPLEGGEALQKKSVPMLSRLILPSDPPPRYHPSRFSFVRYRWGL